ncbi:MAG: hypothetical protein WAV05_09800 [Anaerolineales bacterium]
MPSVTQAVPIGNIEDLCAGYLLSLASVGIVSRREPVGLGHSAAL